MNESLRYIFSLAVFVSIWWAIVNILSIPDFILPSPLEVIKTLHAERSMYATALVATASNWGIGAFLGVFGGIICGLLLGYFRTAQWLVEPYLVVFQSFPRESLFPLLIIWFGFGDASTIAASFLLSFFPVALLAVGAISHSNREYLELLRSWGASRRQEFLHCRIPFAVPRLAAAAKIGVPLALVGAVIGEFLGGGEGLGYIIISSGAQFRIDRTFGAIVILAMFGLSQFAFIHGFENKILINFYRNH